MTFILETDRLVLRKPNDADWPEMRDFFMSPRAQFVGGPFTLGDAWRQYAAEIGHWALLGHGMWAVISKADKSLLGLIGSWHPADWPEKEIGWVVLDRAEGTGIAFEAAQVVLSDAFNRQKWDTAVSYIKEDNARSIALATRLGATLDESAMQPGRPSYPCLVYRHPKQEGIS